MAARSGVLVLGQGFRGSTAAYCVNEFSGPSGLGRRASRILGIGEGETLVLGSARVVDNVSSRRTVSVSSREALTSIEAFEILLYLRPRPAVKADFCAVGYFVSSIAYTTFAPCCRVLFGLDVLDDIHIGHPPLHNLSQISGSFGKHLHE